MNTSYNFFLRCQCPNRLLLAMISLLEACFTSVHATQSTYILLGYLVCLLLYLLANETSKVSKVVKLACCLDGNYDISFPPCWLQIETRYFELSSEQDTHHLEGCPRKGNQLISRIAQGSTDRSKPNNPYSKIPHLEHTITMYRSHRNIKDLSQHRAPLSRCLRIFNPGEFPSDNLKEPSREPIRV